MSIPPPLSITAPGSALFSPQRSSSSPSRSACAFAVRGGRCVMARAVRRCLARMGSCACFRTGSPATDSWLRVESIPLSPAGPCQGRCQNRYCQGYLCLSLPIDYVQAMTSPALESIPVPPRLRDVAAAAGVSMSTASRVLSGAPGASPRSVAAVVAASKRLGYRPNLIARGLRARTTRLVGIIIPGIGNPFFPELVETLEAGLYGASLDMILSDSRGTDTDEARRLQTLLDRQVDGLIMIPAGHHSSAPAMQWAHRSVPIVQIDRQVDGLPAHHLRVDKPLGIRL